MLTTNKRFENCVVLRN